MKTLKYLGDLPYTHVNLDTIQPGEVTDIEDDKIADHLLKKVRENDGKPMFTLATSSAEDARRNRDGKPTPNLTVAIAAAEAEVARIKAEGPTNDPPAHASRLKAAETELRRLRALTPDPND